jgi:L-2-hydroxyglutarate oxidase LhgO
LVSDVDCVVIGAGVIGLAVARALAQRGRDVLIIESERRFGMHTSSRNSEVIHAGIHYAPNSLKARLCVAGRDLLYAYCAQRSIAHRRCGKFTLAAHEPDLATLEKIESNARANGVLDLVWLNADEARNAEPALTCIAALYSPSTGIIDSLGLMQSLLADAENSGATIAFGSRVAGVRPCPAAFDIFIDGEREPVVRARSIVNAAGLGAHGVAAAIAEFPARFIPSISYAKGSYFALSGRAPFSRLIYPAPRFGGHLGIHLTLDVSGAARFGPDLEWVQTLDYAVDPRRAAVFCEAIREYWPQVELSRLQPAYAGIRPRLAGPGEPARDFCISGPEHHGIPGIVNLFGMESPGLTASLAIAEHVAWMLGEG